jgi:hypothetical protein
MGIGARGMLRWAVGGGLVPESGGMTRGEDGSDLHASQSSGMAWPRLRDGATRSTHTFAGSLHPGKPYPT